MKKNHWGLFFTFIVIGILVMGCSPKEDDLPEVLFFKTYDSYLSDGDVSFSVIDSKGKIRRFNQDFKPHILDELLENPESHEEGIIIGTVDQKELNQYYRYVLKINKNSEILTTGNPTEAVLGQEEWYGVRYGKGDTVETILITGGDEWVKINTDKNAEKMVPWITEVLQPVRVVHGTTQKQ
ncbi:hypothetical protein [Bacillus alkalicellulosilyticus]|uniref:hypothetical protein n=1 Tax=Alkalihalobacterium alkalicellulosilyticum TaxID=1912214 RepID=UPI0009988802|nr:hypothetical protein [Bacillus alkalicellulosilyticus]